jgi:hypothetical protein
VHICNGIGDAVSPYDHIDYQLRGCSTTPWLCGTGSRSMASTRTCCTGNTTPSPSRST